MKRQFVIGEPAPWFRASLLGRESPFALDAAGGRWMLMLFAGSAGHPAIQSALGLIAENRDLFDDIQVCFFGVSVDPSDVDESRIAKSLPGIRWFLDYDRSVSSAFGACPGDGRKLPYRPFWLVLDPLLRVRLQAPIKRGSEAIATVRRLAAEPCSMPAPVLAIPEVLSVDMCQHLIKLYEQNGGEESGFMRDVDGVTTTVVDYKHKRRADYTITDEPIINALQTRLSRVIRPLIQRAFQFNATRVERWIVACYEAQTGGHFRRHRDNTTHGTAHRKMAVTINLDTSRYEGGDLTFPEFGPQTYRASTGGALIFSCSLLHEAQPVTKGTRYAFLPFLYDEEGAKLRESNLAFVEPRLRDYKSGLPSE